MWRYIGWFLVSCISGRQSAFSGVHSLKRDKIPTRFRFQDFQDTTATPKKPSSYAAETYPLEPKKITQLEKNIFFQTSIFGFNMLIFRGVNDGKTHLCFFWAQRPNLWERSSASLSWAATAWRQDPNLTSNLRPTWGPRRRVGFRRSSARSRRPRRRQRSRGCDGVRFVRCINHWERNIAEIVVDVFELMIIIVHGWELAWVKGIESISFGFWWPNGWNCWFLSWNPVHFSSIMGYNRHYGWQKHHCWCLVQ